MTKIHGTAAAPIIMALVIGLAGLAAVPAAAAADVRSAQSLSGQELVKAIQGGGYVIFFRHATTDPAQADVDLTILGLCSAQRNLSTAGRQMARDIGVAFRALGIRVDKVLASPFCRTSETADLAFGRHESSAALVSAMGLDRDARTAQSAALRRILATPPATGANVVLVSHNANLKEATGIWPKREGDAHVFLPKAGGGFDHVGEIVAEDWQRIAHETARANRIPEGS